jgi:hypothetical protein
MLRIAVAVGIAMALLPQSAAAQYRLEPFRAAEDVIPNKPNQRGLEAPAAESRWVTGLWIGALGGAALGGGLGAALCSDSDVEMGCAGPVLRGVIFGSIAGGAIGAVIGGFVPREPPSP